MSEDTIRQMESRLALMVLQQRIASVHAWGSLVMKALCTDTSVTGELLANPVRGLSRRRRCDRAAPTLCGRDMLVKKLMARVPALEWLLERSRDFNPSWSAYRKL